MKRRCRHGKTRAGWFKSLHVGEPPHYLLCASCGEWLPLGPANDAPAEVQIEIRAAEIAVCSDELPVLGLLEWAGWVSYPDYDVTSGQALAGYLARAIATHDEPVTTEPRRER